MAWLLRFLDWIKCRVERRRNPRHTADVRKGINQEDLEVAKRKIAILAQKSSYPAEMKSWKEGKPIRSSSRLIKLHFTYCGWIISDHIWRSEEGGE